MIIQHYGLQRRHILFGSAALFACSLAERAMQGMTLPSDPFSQNDVCPDDLPLARTAEAKRLLKTKIDQAVFNPPEVMKNIRQHFTVHIPDWVLAVAAHKQIDNTVDEFAKDNPWDTNKTRHESITISSLMHRYKARISRLFHEHIGPSYAEFLKLPVAEQKQKFDEKFGSLQNILGCSLEQQLGRERVKAEGGLEINSGWNDAPLYQRPSLNFEYMLQALAIKTSPFIVTMSDLKLAGISADPHTKQASVSPGRPSVRQPLEKSGLYRAVNDRLGMRGRALQSLQVPEIS